MADPQNWRRAYHAHQERRVGQLREARARGDRFYRAGDTGEAVDPSRLSDSQIADVALRDAERVLNRAIHKHNEALT